MKLTRDFCLVIPSRERANWLMGRTHSTLKQTASMNPYLYVREDDSQRSAYEKYAERYGAQFLHQKPDALGAAQTYDSLIDWAIREGHEHLVILDDDLNFSMHNYMPTGSMFKLCDARELEALIMHFAALACPEMPALSMTPIMKRSQPGAIAFAHPLMWTYSFYLPHFAKHREHRYWQGKHIEARCDLNLALRLLTQGFLTGFMATCFIPDNVNNPGGCSTYRTLDLEQQSVEYLKATYPDLVRTRIAQGWVGDKNVKREAPVISWKKAFNRKAFTENFNTSPTDFTTRLLTEYETIYADFIRDLRK